MQPLRPPPRYAALLPLRPPPRYAAPLPLPEPPRLLSRRTPPALVTTLATLEKHPATLKAARRTAPQAFDAPAEEGALTCFHGRHKSKYPVLRLLMNNWVGWCCQVRRCGRGEVMWGAPSRAGAGAPDKGRWQ